MATATENIDKSILPRVTIGGQDAQGLREKIVNMKRAALNIQTNAKTFAENADGLIKLLDLIIEKE